MRRLCCSWTLQTVQQRVPLVRTSATRCSAAWFMAPAGYNRFNWQRFEHARGKAGMFQKPFGLWEEDRVDHQFPNLKTGLSVTHVQSFCKILQIKQLRANTISHMCDTNVKILPGIALRDQWRCTVLISPSIVCGRTYFDLERLWMDRS